MYAIVETGGKQYKVAQGDTILTERLPKLEKGASVPLEKVLLAHDGKKVRIGTGAVIGLNAVVLPGADIGDGAILAAGTVLNKNVIVEPRSVYVGVPGVSAKSRHEGEVK